jgi:hypothetical protein
LKKEENFIWFDLTHWTFHVSYFKNVRCAGESYAGEGSPVIALPLGFRLRFEYFTDQILSSLAFSLISIRNQTFMN